MASAWTREAEQQFVELVKEQRPLYDITDLEYSNKSTKVRIWREIEAKLHLEEKELKKKWDSLRTQYTRYLKLPSAQLTGRQIWILNRLRFLEPHCRRMASISNLRSQETAIEYTTTESRNCVLTSTPRPSAPQENSTLAEGATEAPNVVVGASIAPSAAQGQEPRATTSRRSCVQSQGTIPSTASSPQSKAQQMCSRTEEDKDTQSDNCLEEEQSDKECLPEDCSPSTEVELESEQEEGAEGKQSDDEEWDEEWVPENCSETKRKRNQTTDLKEGRPNISSSVPGSEMASAWTSEAEQQFVELVKERRPLYDITDLEYSNKNTRVRLWREIEAELHLAEKEPRKKWDNLRTQYIRYLKLPPSAQLTGRQIQILNRLRFLEPYRRRMASISNLSSQETAVEYTTTESGNCVSTSTLRPSTPLENSILAEGAIEAPMGASVGVSIAPSAAQGQESQASTSRPMASRWTDEAEEQFVELVKARHPLYMTDITDCCYNQCVGGRARDRLWREIEAQLNLAERELRRKWQSLRHMYISYLKLPPSAQLTWRQIWILDRLRFLEPHISNLSSQETAAEDTATESGKQLLTSTQDIFAAAESTKRAIFRCMYCDIEFPRRKNLMVHIPIHTRPFHCDLCDKRYARKGNLISHRRLHTGEKPYTCMYCGRGFHCPNNMKSHMLTHTGEWRHRCHICGKTSIQHLARHMRMHKGEKNCLCTVCGKMFLDMGDLRKHMKHHTGEKPYACKVCGKRFTLRGTLTIHMRSHTGEKPYRCTHCPKAFHDSSGRKRHMYIHAEKKPFECLKCGKGFTEKCNLKTHIRTCKGKVV